MDSSIFSSQAKKKNITVSQKSPVCSSPSLEVAKVLNFVNPLLTFLYGPHCLFVCSLNIVLFSLNHLKTLYKWNHTIHILWWLVSFNLTFYFWDPFMLVYSYTKFLLLYGIWLWKYTTAYWSSLLNALRLFSSFHCNKQCCNTRLSTYLLVSIYKISLGYILGSGSQSIYASLILLGNAKLFSKNVVLIYILTSRVWAFSSLLNLMNSWLYHTS